MAETALPTSARPPFWRDVRVLRALGQVVFVVAVVYVLREMLLNAEYGLARIGQDLSFDFLRSRAGFGIKEGIAYSPNESYLKAYFVGVVNTLRVAGIGILLATLLGIITGVARLSPNWLVRRIAQVYVEVIRNTPLLIQIIFIYVAVILALPGIERGPSLWDVAFLSNRGAAVPRLRFGEGVGIWSLFVLGGLGAAALVWRWRTRVNERTGEPHRRLLWSLPVLLVVAAIGYIATGSPISVEVPKLLERGYEGGFQMSPEFAGVLAGLVIYTAAFIAEIVRGSILAVPKGQREAAEAIGLTPFQQLRFVVLPQAMRVAIPPINSQYLNLTKNSSLGFAIAYPELVSVSSTITNQAGRAIQVLLIVITTYLLLSLVISFFMNLLNRAVALRGERR